MSQCPVCNCELTTAGCPRFSEHRNAYVIPVGPYTCPICGGNGLVSAGFYNKVGDSWASSQTTEACRSCSGTGVLWRPR